MVKLNHQSLNDYPKLRARVAELLPKIERDKHTIWQCFCDISRLSPSFARDVVSGKFGSPTLVVEALDRVTPTRRRIVNGLFRTGTPGVIYICDDIARKGEQPAFGDDPRYWPVVESTILHELVHWSDFKDGTLEVGIELGKKFEKAAYGGDVARFWAPDGAATACGTAEDCEGLRGQGDIDDAEEPEMAGNAPFANAVGGFWPVMTQDPRRRVVSYRSALGRQIGEPSRAFFAPRKKRPNESLATDRHHVGVDLYGRAGDEVRACEDGEIVGIQNFYQGTMAMLVLGASNIVANYGEIAAGSWGSLKVGSRVRAGQTIARIGQLSSSAMCHFETYTGNTRTTSRWLWNEPRPTNVLNPTRYLLALQH